MYSALDVAKYIIMYSDEKGEKMSNLKLQKILYFIQAQYLVGEGYACFTDEIEAWDFGPVVPTVYRYYKGFGCVSIIDTGESREICDKMWPYDKDIINRVVDHFSNSSAFELVKLTHAQDPWKDNYKSYCNNVISHSSILTYFKQ